MRTLEIAKFENVGPKDEQDRLRSRLSVPAITCLQGSIQTSAFLVVEVTEDENVVGVALDERTAESICVQLSENPRQYTMLNRRFLYTAGYKFIKTSLFSTPADAAVLRPRSSEEEVESIFDEPFHEPFNG
jgi:hypothetical protein